ncbi:MAG: Flp family type IVb pilin [Phascolarctobacterium sp.]
MMTHVKNFGFYLRAKFGLSERGVAMTEYAILLAFVAAVAVAFSSENSLKTSITSAVGKAQNAIDNAGSGVN